MHCTTVLKCICLYVYEINWWMSWNAITYVVWNRCWSKFYHLKSDRGPARQWILPHQWPRLSALETGIGHYLNSFYLFVWGRRLSLCQWSMTNRGRPRLLNKTWCLCIWMEGKGAHGVIYTHIQYKIRLKLGI